MRNFNRFLLCNHDYCITEVNAEATGWVLCSGVVLSFEDLMQVIQGPSSPSMWWGVGNG